MAWFILRWPFYVKDFVQTFGIPCSSKSMVALRSHAAAVQCKCLDQIIPNQISYSVLPDMFDQVKRPARESKYALLQTVRLLLLLEVVHLWLLVACL